jgi:hypothetical protein
MDSNVILNKIEAIERCISRNNEVYEGNIENHIADFTEFTSLVIKLL